MTRIVKEHDVRRSEILDVAQQFFFEKGFEPTSIQDIVDTVGIAKGTFYHYFDSKLHLLDALIDRMLSQTLQVVAPMVGDDQLTAVEKLNGFFAHVAGWKTDNRSFFLEVTRVWRNDENAMFRHRLKMASDRRVAPILTTIIHQGVAEGEFFTNCPDDLGVIILHIGQFVGDAVSDLLLQGQRDDTRVLATIEAKVAAYEHVVARLLGVPDDRVVLFAVDELGLWLD